jgi:aspartate aminotransferase-like enzyme
MQKGYLLAPGPTSVPPGLLLAMSASMFHHRVPACPVAFGKGVAAAMNVLAS